ncbi:nestin [Xyrichtys novacula]|uniref:Nestin n=1 Tax=Xyrichtys novacula TaxID=13765 RepID=A0AAV1FRP4_XYRNO|nr:nestin [Xyrichtys novacula]
MELFTLQKTLQHSHMGEEKHQMLNLNRRLETYLNRVKHLEEENALLAKEVQALRRSNHGALSRRKGLEEELHRGRLEVEAAWRDRVYTEMEVGRMIEELHELDVQRQREAQVKVEAKKRLENSRKELEEEQRAQIWLRDKVGQLENELRHLVQTHEEEVVHLEAKLTLSRSTVPPAFTQRRNPNLLELGQEFSQRATRAWQEAAEAYQGQLAQMEESLNQTRSRLIEVNQERSESQLKLQTLEKEIVSAQDVRTHLERTADQQGQRYSLEIQQLQEHLEALEMEKGELGQKIESILLENRGLLQAKMSLGLEVATYRALLDGESFRGNTFQRNTDAVFSPHGVKKNYHTQLPASHKTTSLSSVRGVTGTGLTARAAAPVWSQRPVTVTETPKAPTKSANKDEIKPAPSETPYPRILQDGAVENFRPQEVEEKVTYAEPLSPPNEQEVPAEVGVNEEGRNNNGVEHPEESFEAVIQHQVQSILSKAPPPMDEAGLHQFDTPTLTPYHVRIKEESCSFPDEPDENESAENQHVEKPRSPVAAWEEKKDLDKELEHLREETSDSETEAMLEPTFESRTSSPVSEDDGNILKEDAAETRQEMSRSAEVKNKTSEEDKLYPDGEEMDTWDSVIERKVERKDENIKVSEEKLQRAEPEEDISAREQKQGNGEVTANENVASSITDKEAGGDDGRDFSLDQEHEAISDKEEDEDSQNVSVSWRTELESDSYVQDNTLADTRPLIRYKSDETDANTHASHMDESESSEGEQEKKAGEAGSGTWGESKSKRFGTMEDLCEEVEGEALDEDYDLGYTHIEDQVVVHEINEDATESAEEIFRKVSEGCWGVETEEDTKAMAFENESYDEELETDRLVEQELENLETDSYSAHFTKQQISRCEDVVEFVEETTGPENAEDIPSFTKPELASFDSGVAQPPEEQDFSEVSLEKPQREADEMDHLKDQETAETIEEERHVSKVIPVGVQSGFSEPLSLPDLEEKLKPAEQENPQDKAAEEAEPVEESTASQEHLVKDVTVRQGFPEVPETTAWDVLDDSAKIGPQTEDHEKCESAEGSHLSDKDSDQGGRAFKAEPAALSPESVPSEDNIFMVKDSAELSNGKDKGRHDFFSSGVQSDLWMSSLETGASYQPDDSFNEAAEQTNKNQGFADDSLWGDLEDPNVVNKNSKVNIDSAQALDTTTEMKKQTFTEVKKQMCRNVVEGEFVHSEESDVEGESWSSEEETE